MKAFSKEFKKQFKQKLQEKYLEWNLSNIQILFILERNLLLNFVLDFGKVLYEISITLFVSI